jgi:hypothetical protein
MTHYMEAWVVNEYRDPEDYGGGENRIIFKSENPIDVTYIKNVVEGSSQAGKDSYIDFSVTTTNAISESEFQSIFAQSVEIWNEGDCYDFDVHFYLIDVDTNKCIWVGMNSVAHTLEYGCQSWRTCESLNVK